MIRVLLKLVVIYLSICPGYLQQLQASIMYVGVLLCLEGTAEVL